MKLRFHRHKMIRKYTKLFNIRKYVNKKFKLKIISIDTGSFISIELGKKPS